MNGKFSVHNIIIRFAPELRFIKSMLQAAVGMVHCYVLSRLKPKSSKGRFVLLTLGAGKGSSFVAKEVARQGYDLVLIAPHFPRIESRFAIKWVKADLFSDYGVLKEKVVRENPIAVLVEQRNILLPIKARLNHDLGLVDYGLKSCVTSNSKIELRNAIDEAGLPNIPWSELQEEGTGILEFPFIFKPETGTGSRGISVVRNDQDLVSARKQLRNLEQDETVGGRVMLEKCIEGRQFDVEGVASNGSYTFLSLTEEHYDIVGQALPSSWYLFSPPLTEAMRSAINAAAAEFLGALGVQYGAFHCEMRVDAQGGIYAIDYSNRMGYPLLVSHCCGLSFPGAYVKVMAGESIDKNIIEHNSVFQQYIREEADLRKFKSLVSENPKSLVQKNFIGANVGGVYNHARYAIKASSFQQMNELLNQYDLVPASWINYYGNDDP